MKRADLHAAVAGMGDAPLPRPMWVAAARQAGSCGVGVGQWVWRARFHAGCLAWLLAGMPTAHAQVYARLDAQGQLQVSSTPVQGATSFDPHQRWQPRARDLAPAPARRPQAPLQPPARWQPVLQQVAQEHGVEPSLLHAVIQVESGYNPKARSPAGALGLMQVIPSTGRRFGATDLYDPVQNLRAGTRYLAWLQQRFNGDLALTLAAYNAGEGAVQKHGGRVPPYAETQAYVRRVSAIYHAGRNAGQVHVF